VHYLSQILLLVAHSFGELANLSFKDNKRATVESFKILVGNVREKCLQAACAAWSDDCDNARVLEDWTRATERPDLTNLPSRLMNYEGFILVNLQKILFISDAAKTSGNSELIVPPSNKLLQMVRSQFVGGLYKVINGMKEHAESPSMDNERAADALTTPARDPAFVNVASSSIDASNKVIYKQRS